MACRLLSTKPLYEPMLIYYQTESLETNFEQQNLNENQIIFVQEN